MRWVFYSLLVVNLVYLGFKLTQVVSANRQPVLSATQPEAAPGQRLVLLSESPQAAKAGRRQAVASLCPVVGPWSTPQSAKAGAVQLQAAGLAGQVKVLTIQKDRLNWVYLPPYGDRERALLVLRELQDHGVDSFLVKEGEDANAISLGYFSSAESAEGLRVKMRNAGYPAFVRETSKSVTEYWFYLRDRSQESAPELKVFLDANQGLSLDRVACE